MKTNGALWNEFYNDEEYWKGMYHDDTLVLADGVEHEDLENALPDSSVVDIQSGYVYSEGTGMASHDLTLESFFRKWKKKHSTEMLIVSVDKSVAASIKSQIKLIAGVKSVK